MRSYVKDLIVDPRLFRRKTFLEELKSELLAITCNPLFKEEEEKVKVDILWEVITQYQFLLTPDEIEDLYTTFTNLDNLKEH